jgi:hypothetical protein
MERKEKGVEGRGGVKGLMNLVCEFFEVGGRRI